MSKHGKHMAARVQATVLAAAMVFSGMPLSAAAADVKEPETRQPVQSELASGERKISFNEDWRFYREDGTSVQAEGKDFDDSQWRTVTLPHDYSIELDFDPKSPAGSGGGFLNGGVGWYRKTFVLPESMKGKRISIDFGGVYMDSTTYVNGEMIGNYPYGYSPFSYDITDQLVADGVTENVIAVRVNNQQPSSRWYSGSGIYRNVNLVVTDDIHVERYGTFVTTPDLEEHYGKDEAVVSVETKVANDGELPANAVVTSTIYDSEGNLFAEPVTTEAKEIAAGEVVTFEQMINTEKPQLWSVDDPNLYEMVSEISVDGSVVDTYETTFGFRWVTMDPNDGFYLNGEYMKLHGMCMHHDQGALGAVANYRAIERQMEIMKSMGVNAIRVTHNPAADELIEICNKLGLMVIDEAFDCWETGKTSKDYARFFRLQATHPDAEDGETWAEFDIKNMVNRGKNDPCIILWSIGNEVLNGTVPTATNLVNWVAEVDPTRPATEGFNDFIGGFTNEKMKQVADVTGVVGFNYGEYSYDAAHKEYPEWIIMGTETSSAVRSRGFYKIDATKKIRSCYDDGNTVSWGRSAEAAWKADRDRRFVMGEFVWTGFDYIGEPSPYNNQYPAKSSYFGAVDTAGIPKDAYYIYQSQWTSAEENPMVHLLPHWNWEGDDSIKTNGKIKVQAYSNAASVELFLNDESLGKKEFLQKKTSDGRDYQEAEDGHIYLEWMVDYQPGELKAVARDLEGNVIAEDVLTTAGEPAQVRLTPDREVITADGRDLSYILVEILDKDGNLVPTADNNVKFHVSGNGKIVGVDNGDATEVTQSYKGSERKAYSGKAMVIVQSTKDAGEFTLSASSLGLRSDKTKVFTMEDTEEEELLGYEEPEIIYVEKGEAPVLPETVTAVYSSGRKEYKEVSWNEISEDVLQTLGSVTVTGTVEETGDPVSLQMIVTGTIGIRPVHIVTEVGEIPQLPETVTILSNLGDEKEASVVWEEIREEQVASVGSFTVKGIAEDYAGEVTASVRVAELNIHDGRDQAPKKETYPIPTASYEYYTYKAAAINNGNVYREARLMPAELWGAWFHNQADEWVQLEFEYPITTAKAGINFWYVATYDRYFAMPDSVTISYSMDGQTFTDVENQSISNKEDLKIFDETEFTFDEITAKYIRWNFHSEVNKAPMVSEVHVYQRSRFDMGDSAQLKGLQLDGIELEGFTPEQDYYEVELPYNAPVPEVTAEAEDPNASVCIIPAIDNNESAVIQVVSEDGYIRKNYMVQFREAAPKLDEVTIQMESDTLTEDDVKPISLTAILEDGKALKNGVLDVHYTVGNPEIAEVKDGCLYAYWAGTTTLKAAVTYQGVTVESNELELTIQENPEPKVITGYEQVSVITVKGQAPALPAKVKATFDKGLAKQVKVTWDDIDPAQYEKYGSFTVKGSVDGQDLRPEAKVTVKGILGVQQFSGATPLGTIPQLPLKAKVYYSDGTTDELEVAWEEHPQDLFMEDGKVVTIKGTVTDQKGDGSVHETQATIRVSADVVKGDKFTAYKNGFYLPLGIASFTNGQGSSGDSASELNDNIVSRVPGDNNRWCNWSGTHRDEDWAGIIFGLEEVTYKFIDNLEIDFYTDYGADVPAEYVIEYYDGEYFNTRPKDPNNVGSDHPTGLDENWKPVTNLQAPEELSATETCYFTFDSVRTCAIRIRMKAASDKCLAITEMGAYDKLVTANNDFKVTGLLVDGEALEDFDPAVHSYTVDYKDGKLPQVQMTADNNASVTMIQATDTDDVTTFLVTSEDGLKTETYTISYIEYDMARVSLRALYRAWASEDLSVYTKESAEALTEALAAAEAVLADKNASRKAMDQAVSNLVAAIGGLEYDIQKLHLEVAIDAAEKLLALGENYEETEALAEAVEGGKAVLTDENATQEAVDNAAYAILDNLFRMAKKADISSLESLIEAAKGLLDGKYTSDSLENLKEAIDAAEAVVADQNRGDSDISDAYANLIDAIINLKLKGNKAALEAMLKKANEVLSDADAYVAETIEGLAEVTEAAQAVYDNENALQSEVNEAVKALSLKVAEARLLGDVDGDGDVTTADSAAVLRSAAELDTLSAEAAASADVNGDGKADTSDAVMILKYAAEEITAF